MVGLSAAPLTLEARSCLKALLPLHLGCTCSSSVCGSVLNLLQTFIQRPHSQWSLLRPPSVSHPAPHNIPISLLPLLFSLALSLSNIFSWFIIHLPPLGCKLCEDRDFCLSASLLNLQHLELCPAQSSQWNSSS